MLGRVRNLIDQMTNKDDVDFITQFWSSPVNAWIKNDRILTRVFTDFFNAIPKHYLKRLSTGNPIALMSVSGRYACAFSSLNDHHVIIVFPELLRKLKAANYNEALAIIAHEFGHIVFDHSNKKIQSIEAQVQADLFAYECGFGEELQEFLMECPDTIETKVRISKLTYLLLNLK